MAQETVKNASYSQFACIGSGFSAIAVGVQLKRWYGITDIRFFERNSDLGGTWLANQYPGSGCDIPSLLYSYSFAPNPNWSTILPSHNEIWEYQNGVAIQYGLRDKMSFNSTVEKCEWIEQTKRWRIFVRNTETDSVLVHESQFLFGASGFLVHPRKPDIRGLETFKGTVVHSSMWDHDIDLRDKKVVVVGNGCTATQIVPAIQDTTRHVTQFVRSKHWIIPPVNAPNTKFFQFLFTYVPGFLKFTRFLMFWVLENDMWGFHMNKMGAAYRRYTRGIAERYMKKHAPEKYWDLLIPDFEIGCKRRIFDCGYLKGLHKDNVTLTSDPIVEVTAEGVRSKNGFTEADIIIMANGFETNTFLTNIEVIGRGGVTATEHWEEMGGAGAYNSTSLSGFPNFFIILGPNIAQGHTSVLIAAENAVNYSLRVIKPILDGNATAVDAKLDAEKQFIEKIQRDLQTTVYSSGCNPWYNRAADGGKQHNGMTYPHWQPHFWYKCLFPIYTDFKYDPAKNLPRRGLWNRLFNTALWLATFASVGGVLVSVRKNGWDIETYLPFMKEQVQHWLNSARNLL